ncbi:MAG: pyridine nucleotide-disulfide oxidoreductase, partial [Nocardioidaceae bacterium]
PTFALGHAALALLGHECGAPVARQARVESARRHAPRGTERERSHVHAVLRHLDGDPAPMIAHLRAHPRDALLLSAAVPTIAFAGVTTVPADAWAIVERCGTAYGDDWWYAGLLAFVRQEQARFEESFELACRSLQEEPRAGHSVHARCHVHYETGDHGAGLSWLDGWITGGGQSADNLAHFSWHAALHELSLDDVTAVRARWDDQLAPPAVTGCRALVDSASLLWRWSLTSGPEGLPDAVRVLEHVDGDDIDHPPSGFMAMHAAVAVCAAGDVDRLHRLDHWCRVQSDPVLSGVAAPLAASLVQLGRGHGSVAADGLARLEQQIWRLGGSDAQREVVEDTRIAALLSAGRNAEARRLLDRRLDRRASPRDSLWREKSVSR